MSFPSHEEHKTRITSLSQIRDKSCCVCLVLLRWLLSLLLVFMLLLLLLLMFCLRDNVGAVVGVDAAAAASVFDFVVLGDNVLGVVAIGRFCEC